MPFYSSDNYFACRSGDTRLCDSEAVRRQLRHALPPLRRHQHPDEAARGYGGPVTVPLAEDRHRVWFCGGEDRSLEAVSKTGPEINVFKT